MKLIIMLALAAATNTIFATPTKTAPSQSKCPFCQMPVLNDTAFADFRVTIRFGGKSTEYRCVLCAVADAKTMPGDLTIEAASESKGHPVKISRSGGKWTVSPETAVFAYAEGDHDQCQTRYRALTSAEAFEAYVKANPKVLKGAKQVTLPQFVKLAG